MKLTLIFLISNVVLAGQWMKVKKDLIFTNSEGSRSIKVLVKDQKIYDTSNEILNSVAEKVFIIDNNVCENLDDFAGKKVLLDRKWKSNKQSPILWVQRYPYTRVWNAGLSGQKQKIAEYHSPDGDVPTMISLPNDFEEKLLPEMCLLLVKTQVKPRKYEMQSKVLKRKKKAISKALNPYLEIISYDYGIAE